MTDRVERIAGVDEAGRGPLAGPVVAAAVILPAEYHLPGLTDSKKLSEGKRQEFEILIKEQALAWAVSLASVQEIDKINILQATMLAMQRSVMALSVNPSLVLVDGNRAPSLSCRVECIVKGDLKEPCISAASILAKEARDRMMRALDEQYPEYGFARHKAYPTAQHRAAIIQYGVCPHHRRSFKPVRQALSI